MLLIQSLSHVWLFVTPWTATHQASLSFTISQNLLKLMCLLSWWCHSTISSSVTPFCSCPQSFPASESFPVSHGLFSGGQSIGASASASILPTPSWLISFRTDWFDLLTVQGTLKSLLQHNSKASILRHTAFFMVQLSHPSMTTGKTIALTRPTFLAK